MVNKFNKKNYLLQLIEDNKKFILGEEIRERQDQKIFEEIGISKKMEDVDSKIEDYRQLIYRENAADKPDNTKVKRLNRQIEKLTHDRNIIVAEVMSEVLEEMVK